MDRKLFDHLGEMPDEGFPLMVEITVEYFAVRRGRSLGKPYDPPGGSHPSHLTINVLQESSEALGSRDQLVVLGADLCTPGRYLPPLGAIQEH